MRCIYSGRVQIPHSEYEQFREMLMQIPAAKFRASLTDRWGARATVLYDAKSDEFYEKASKRKVIDAASAAREGAIPLTELGRASMSGNDEQFLETMNRLQLQNRSGNHRSRHRKVQVPKQYYGGSF